MPPVGIVVIGRNEGTRLHKCLQSVVGNTVVIYVDSGSTDNSVALAKSLGVHVVELDLSVPFTAARARNTGWEYLLHICPQVEFVQFVDGDCQVVPGWLEVAQQELLAHPDVVVVCGRRRELFPADSVYNLLCDIEWDTPVGEAKACGGDAMMRLCALQQVGGFNGTLIAGEEPELCVRLRGAGGRVLRLDADMTWHDAQMTRWEQWWLRSRRAGHAYAEGASLHGRTSERHWVKESRSNWLWGLTLPVVAIATAPLTWGLSIVALAMLYTVLAYRIYSHQKQRGLQPADAAIYSLFCLLGKFPQAQGQLQFHLSRWLRRPPTLVEYKSIS